MLLLLYGAVMALHAARGRSVDCGCGGEPLPVSWALVARNALLALLAGLAALPMAGRSLGAGDFLVVAAALLLATLLHAALHQVGRREVLDALAAQLDRALGDGAALALEQVGHGTQGGRLARAIAAQQRHDAAFGHLQRHALEHEDDVVVDHLDAIDVEDYVGGFHVPSLDVIPGPSRDPRRRRQCDGRVDCGSRPQ